MPVFPDLVSFGCNNASSLITDFGFNVQIPCDHQVHYKWAWLYSNILCAIAKKIISQKFGVRTVLKEDIVLAANVGTYCNISCTFFITSCQYQQTDAAVLLNPTVTHSEQSRDELDENSSNVPQKI